MRLFTAMAAFLALASARVGQADNRVEFVGRVAFNGLNFGICPGSGQGADPCPWNDVHLGTFIHATFITTGDGQNLILPEDLILHPDAQARGFDIVPGSYLVGTGGRRMNIVVTGVPYNPNIPNSGTSPGMLFAHRYWTVDSFLVSGGVLTRAGTCCYPNGSCTFVLETDCAGVWTFAGACVPTTCAQPNGACCEAGNICTLTNQAACSGTWAFGETCTPGICPMVVGACCQTGGSCAIMTSESCSGAWTQGGACTPENCATPAVIGDYAMDLDHFAHSPADMFTSAVIGENVGVYPGSLFNESRSWLIFYADQGLPYEMFIDIERMVISEATVAMGSCCPGDGHCLVTSQLSCPTAAWTSGGVCNPGSCPSSAGACCYADGTCALVTPASCAGSANSIYQGDNTSCTAGICPATGACCASGACTVIIQTACAATGGSWLGAGSTCSTRPQHLLDVGGPTGLTLPDATFNSAGDIPATFTSDFFVSNASSVQSLQVWLHLSTGRLNDLKVRLTGPNGATVDLFSRMGAKPPLCAVTPIGPGHPMFNTPAEDWYVFQDSAALSFNQYVVGLPSGAVTVPGRYKPAGCGGTPVSLNAAFAGTSATGVWRLTVIDERSGIAAKLYDWGLSINGGNPPPCTVGGCSNGTSCSATTFAECSGVWSLTPCAPPVCGAGSAGACCLLDTCAVICQAQCPASARFNGQGTACTAVACLAACCLSSGACVMATPTDCSGTPGAPGATCTPNACPQPVACCLSSGACTLGLPGDCTGTVGTAGSTCTPNTCPHPASPANDVCAAVMATGPDVVLFEGTWSAIGATMTGATSDGVMPTCDSGLATADVWWRFVPPATGSYTISNCGNPVWDTSLSIWTNCSSQLPGSCVDDNCSTSASSSVYGHEKVTAALTGGAPYMIRVGAFSPTTVNVGDFALSVTALGACCNNTQSTCTLTSVIGCLGGRVYQGDHTSCLPNPCGPAGACCRGTTCTLTGPAACSGTNSLFAGSNTVCNSFFGDPTTPCCLADFNHLGGVTVQDIFDFLNAYFAQDPIADITGGGVGVQDIFDFLNAYFGGC